MNPYTLILGIFLIAGIATTAWGWMIIVRGRGTRRWPAVSGSITRSAVRDHDSIPDITFTYTVNGTTYRCVHRFPSGTQPSQELTAQYLTKFPLGTPVTVHYDPSHPQHATIEPGLARGDWLIFALGLIATVFGAIFLLFGGVG